MEASVFSGRSRKTQDCRWLFGSQQTRTSRGLRAAIQPARTANQHQPTTTSFVDVAGEPHTFVGLASAPGFGLRQMTSKTSVFSTLDGFHIWYGACSSVRRESKASRFFPVVRSVRARFIPESATNFEPRHALIPAFIALLSVSTDTFLNREGSGLGPIRQKYRHAVPAETVHARASGQQDCRSSRHRVIC